jgi:hypothetical protein
MLRCLATSAPPTNRLDHDPLLRGMTLMAIAGIVLARHTVDDLKKLLAKRPEIDAERRGLAAFVLRKCVNEKRGLPDAVETVRFLLPTLDLLALAPILAEFADVLAPLPARPIDDLPWWVSV